MLTFSSFVKCAQEHACAFIQYVCYVTLWQDPSGFLTINLSKGEWKPHDIVIPNIYLEVTKLSEPVLAIGAHDSKRANRITEACCLLLHKRIFTLFYSMV